MKPTLNKNNVEMFCQNISIKWFTLVELIVVISILAILWTIAFLSFNSFSSKARDSTRISDTTNLKKWLELYSVKSGYYPLPDSDSTTTISSWTVNWYEVAYKWIISDNISRNININKVPTDPLNTNQKYIYWTTYDKKYYQIATTLEDTQTAYIIQDTYAAWNEKAKVWWFYNWIIKFSTWWQVFLANVPSLIYNFSWSLTNDLFSTNTYFIYNNKSNLPYKVWNIINTNNTTSDTLIKDITGYTWATLTWVNITTVTKDTLQTTFTQEILKSFNTNQTIQDISNTTPILESISKVVLWNTSVNYSSCTLSWKSIPHWQSINAYSENTILWNASYDCTNRQLTRTCNNWILNWDNTYQYTSCVKWTPTNCTATTYNSYDIPQLNHTQSWIWTKSITNWTWYIVASCNDWALNYWIESASCDTWYYQSWNSCLAYVNWSCISIPTNATYFNNTTTYSLIDALNWTSLTANYNATPTTNTCQFKCDTNFAWNWSGCEYIYPTWLSLSHISGRKTFTFSWNWWTVNNNCKLQYNDWWNRKNVNNIIYNCWQDYSWEIADLPSDWWISSWSNLEVRLALEDNTNLWRLGYVKCSLLSTWKYSQTTTPNIDEDCNWYWDNTVVTYYLTLISSYLWNSGVTGYSTWCNSLTHVWQKRYRSSWTSDPSTYVNYWWTSWLIFTWATTLTSWTENVAYCQCNYWTLYR